MSNYYAKPLREVIEWAVSCNGDEPRKSIDELVAEVKSSLEAEDKLLWAPMLDDPRSPSARHLADDLDDLS